MPDSHPHQPSLPTISLGVLSPRSNLNPFTHTTTVTTREPSTTKAKTQVRKKQATHFEPWRETVMRDLSHVPCCLVMTLQVIFNHQQLRAQQNSFPSFL